MDILYTHHWMILVNHWSVYCKVQKIKLWIYLNDTDQYADRCFHSSMAIVMVSTYDATCIMVNMIFIWH